MLWNRWTLAPGPTMRQRNDIENTRFGPPRWEDAAPRLMPRLRSGAWVDQLELDARRSGEAHLRCHMELVSGIHVTLVLDSEDTMVGVTTRMLNAWGRSFFEACDRAVQNLATRSHERMIGIADGVWVAPWRDAYAASRVLLGPDKMTGLGEGDELLVAVPDRDTLLVARPDVALAVEALVLAIENTSGDGLPVSQRIFRWHSQRPGSGLAPAHLEPYAVPHDHPASVLHRNLVTRERMARYAEQHRPLQEAAGDVHVARAEADEGPDGLLVSRALWTQRVDALLPEVDRVHMLETYSDGTSSRMWVIGLEDLLAVPGALQRARTHMPRWRTHAFPDGETLRRLATPLERDRCTAELDSGDEWPLIDATKLTDAAKSYD